ncbi:molybdenum ABC transporter ATP-binding protein [Nordella sp. HKS 07]|uniref:molybdenum ABC transporter ATP-binding protein n=1 Tax=Nordella sp. HKS 07 TaxID=2712222 RepID=UPI0013E10FA5|nr:molybdenum ABC transporter ATP-binding protein [Nordella sp. HKS 07]QIG47107.1 molybdenum ABC transporter ATP-binding protein [Nordella sp. HKS 07]
MIEIDVVLARPGFTLAVKFDAGQGITALFGESGAGKSTVLHLVAGLLKPDRGRISVNGTVFTDTGARIFLPPHRRRIGYVFQDALLFPHLSVRQNLLYGRWFTKAEPNGITLDQVTELLGIAALLERRPTTLSGGERQRVAIGRALLASPQILLMDEPLAALDIDRKREIIPYIQRLRDELDLPILYVSHAIEEVARLADRVILMAGGQVKSDGPPQQVLSPKAGPGDDRFARVSILSTSQPSYDADYQLTQVSHPAGKITLAGRLIPQDGPIRVLIRATDVTIALSKPRELSIRTAMRGKISAISEPLGAVVMVEIELIGGEILAAAVTRKAVDELGLGEGDHVYCLIKSVSIDDRLMATP